MDQGSRVSVELKEREPTHRMQPPQWMTSFKMLRYSIKSEESRAAFDALYRLVENEGASYKIFRAVGRLQGFISILQYFSGFNIRRGQRWSEIHSDEVIENLLKEIQGRKRRSLE